MNSYWEVTSQISIGLGIFFCCYFGHDFTLSYRLLFSLIFQRGLFIIFVLPLLVWINKPHDLSPDRKTASPWMGLWWSTRLASQPPAETSWLVMTGCVTNSACVPTGRSSECRWPVRTWAARPQTTPVQTHTRRAQEDISRFILWLFIFLRLGMHILFLQSLW